MAIDTVYPVGTPVQIVLTMTDENITPLEELVAQRINSHNYWVHAVVDEVLTKDEFERRFPQSDVEVHVHVCRVNDVAWYVWPENIRPGYLPDRSDAEEVERWLAE